jgi:ABC-type glycerol-3-phosphate transport system permease component
MSRLPRSERRVELLVHAALVCLALIWAYPVIWTVTNSLKTTGDLYSAPWNLPNPPHLENIVNAWVQGQLGLAFLNSAYVTVVSVSLILLFAIPAAFGFARLKLPLHAVARARHSGAVDDSKRNHHGATVRHVPRAWATEYA